MRLDKAPYSFQTYSCTFKMFGTSLNFFMFVLNVVKALFVLPLVLYILCFMVQSFFVLGLSHSRSHPFIFQMADKFIQA